MFNEFYTYTAKLFNKQNKILLAISGGADSVAMLDLFSKTSYMCGVAHCNFHLRAKESDKDEELVKNLAGKYNYPYFKIDFETKKYATENKISIEMAARELRYNWFEKIRQDNDYQHIATAHHQDDLIETFFINLARGTGIRGLSGIKPKSGKVVRPILFADRAQIMAYINHEKLKYREDTTNYDVKFKRNKLRNDIIPEFVEINQAYKKNILKTIERLNFTNQILQKSINKVKADVVHEKDQQLFFNIAKLKQIAPLNFHLFELLYPYGFNGEQVDSIVESIDGISGKCFYSATHQLVKDRDYLIVALKQNKLTKPILIANNQSIANISEQLSLQINTISITKSFKITKQANIATLDKDKLHFPLEIRNWQKGDYFYPIGMGRKKKLSDFFIDNKFSKIEKEKTQLLISEEKIVWIIGHRIDNRYKITSSTKNILIIEYKN